MDNEQLARIEIFLREKMFETNIPGLVFALRDLEGNVIERAYGFSNVAQGIPTETDTCFAIGSLTKSFTAIAILQLKERKKLNLTDRVSKYLPKLVGTYFDNVTIHHLLSHTSGVSTLGNAERSLFSQIYNQPSKIQIAREKNEELFYESLRHAEDWLVGEPGKVFSYLNEGFTLLHDIVEIVSGTTYEDYIERNIFQPLGMSNTFFLGRVDKGKFNIATAYSTISSRIPVEVGLIGGTPGSGSIYSNVRDMGKFIGMLLSRGQIADHRFLNQEEINMMERIHAESNSIEIGPNGAEKVRDSGYGYGLNISDHFFDNKLISHSGSIFVHTAYMGYIPSVKVYTILFCNTTAYPLGNIGRYALALTLRKNPDDLLFMRNGLIVQKLVGRYESYGGSLAIDISAAGEFLHLKPNYSNETILLIPELLDWTKATFYTLQGSTKVFANFSVLDDNHVEVNYSAQKMKKVV